jgi:hypothetical protein
LQFPGAGGKIYACQAAMKSNPATRIQGISRFLLMVCLLRSVSALAHEPSRSYLNLTLDSGRLNGRLEVPLRDLQNVVSFGEINGSVTGPQIAAHYHGITNYAFSHLQFAVDDHLIAPQFANDPPEMEELSDGPYLKLKFVLEYAQAPQKLEIGYHLFFETNSLHRGLVRVEAGGKTQIAAFSPNHSSETFQFAMPSGGRQFLAFVHEGVWHIWTGYDHILFLLALLLPSVLQRKGGQWREVSALRPAFFNVLKIVSAFTLAHSLTLSLAALGIVRLPSRFTESAIALSVILAAANNLWPLVSERGWMVAFGFGLIHGFGFATALSDLGMTSGCMALTLVGFNAGVELGQLAIVAVFLPLAFALRRTWLYQTSVLRLGSVCVMLVASAWCAERVMNLKFVPF